MKNIFSFISVLCIIALCSQTLAATFSIGNLLISTQNEIHEYTIKGVFIQTVPIEYPGGYSSTEYARDIAADSKGQTYVYNGTFNPYVSQFVFTNNPPWKHMNHTGFSTINNSSYGGIDVSGNTVFATDMETSSGEPQGIVAFNSKTGNAIRFAEDTSPIDLTIGLDGMLYSLSPGGSPEGRTVNIYHPTSLVLVKSIILTDLFGWSGHRSIAVDYNGDIFLADWDGEIHRIRKNDGSIETITPSCNWIGRDISCAFFDINISENGKIALGTRFGEVIITDTNFSNISIFEVGDDNIFVEFVPSSDIIIPEPKTPTTTPIINFLLTDKK